MKRQLVGMGIVLLGAAVIAAGCKQPAVDNTRADAGAQARYSTLTIPSGTTVLASLGSRLDTGTNHAGDPFVATTNAPIVIAGRTVVAQGAQIRGTLTDVQASGRISGRARLTLGFDSITDSGGTTHAISAQPITMQAASKTHGDVEKIAAGGVLGAIVGGITGGGKGAAIGAGAGAGAGTILMLATKGDEVELAVGQRLTIRMTAPTDIQVLAQR
ncbi:MAG: hypothetical protein ACYDIE_04265 [Candidatus Krumholzibacteriia bacterium]